MYDLITCTQQRPTRVSQRKIDLSARQRYERRLNHPTKARPTEPCAAWFKFQPPRAKFVPISAAPRGRRTGSATGKRPLTPAPGPHVRYVSQVDPGHWTCAVSKIQYLPELACAVLLIVCMCAACPCVCACARTRPRSARAPSTGAIPTRAGAAWARPSLAIQVEACYASPALRMAVRAYVEVFCFLSWRRRAQRLAHRREEAEHDDDAADENPGVAAVEVDEVVRVAALLDHLFPERANCAKPFGGGALPISWLWERPAGSLENGGKSLKKEKVQFAAF